MKQQYKGIILIIASAFFFSLGMETNPFSRVFYYPYTSMI